MINIINLTPHDISVQKPDGTIQVFPVSGTVARVSSSTYKEIAMKVNGIPMVVVDYGKVEGIPEILPRNTMFIVSSIVLEVLDSTIDNPRDRVYMSPDTGNTAIRDDKGNILAVRRFRLR